MKTEQEIIDFLESILPLTREEVTELIFPHDTVAWRTAYIKSNVSTCALVSMAYLRFLGFSAPELDKPYQKQIGMAISNIVTIGRREKAWLTGKDLLSFPEIGDIVLIGTNGNEHVLNVTGVSDGNSLLLSTDGGQSNLSTVAHRERMMITYNGLAYLVDPITPYKNSIPNGRVISGIFRVNKLSI